MTPSEAARLLEMSSDGVRAAIRRGDLPALRTQTGVRILDRAEVEAFGLRRKQARDEQGDAA